MLIISFSELYKHCSLLFQKKGFSFKINSGKSEPKEIELVFFNFTLFFEFNSFFELLFIYSLCTFSMHFYSRRNQSRSDWIL